MMAWLFLGAMVWFGCGGYGVYRTLRGGVVDQIGDGILSVVVLFAGPIGLAGVLAGDWLWGRN